MLRKGYGIIMTSPFHRHSISSSMCRHRRIYHRSQSRSLPREQPGVSMAAKSNELPIRNVRQQQRESSPS